MVVKGFLIQDICDQYMIKLIQPPFQKVCLFWISSENSTHILTLFVKLPPILADFPEKLYKDRKFKNKIMAAFNHSINCLASDSNTPSTLYKNR